MCCGTVLYHPLTSTTQEHVDTLHNVILLGVVGVFLGWNFEHRRNGGVVILENVSNVVGNVLIDQDNANILTDSKILKGFLNLLQLGVGLDDQKIGSFGGPVSHPGQEKARDGILRMATTK